MRAEGKKAQSILEYVILFGFLTALVAAMLIGYTQGSGGFQDKLKNCIEGK